MLDPGTQEPTAAAYVLIGMTLLVPLILGAQFFASIFAFFQALGGGGGVDDLTSYDAGAYLPPL